MSYESTPPEWDRDEQNEYDSWIDDIDWKDMESVLDAIDVLLDENTLEAFCEIVIEQDYTQDEIKLWAKALNCNEDVALEEMTERFDYYKKEDKDNASSWFLPETYAYKIRSKEEWSKLIYHAYWDRFDTEAERRANNINE